MSIAKIMLKQLFFILALFTYPVVSFGQETLGDINQPETGDAPISIIEPQTEITEVNYAAIDDERFELGLYYGALAVADFPTSSLTGASFTYHITPAWIAQLHHAEATVGKPYYEEQASAEFSLLRDDRKYHYTSFSLGYRLLTGRSFLGENAKFNSDLYLLGGLGSTTFHGFTTNSFLIGTSYRVVLTDFMVANLDFRTHSVKRDDTDNTLDDGKRKLNNEFSIGLNWLF